MMPQLNSWLLQLLLVVACLTGCFAFVEMETTSELSDEFQKALINAIEATLQSPLPTAGKITQVISFVDSMKASLESAGIEADKTSALSEMTCNEALALLARRFGPKQRKFLEINATATDFETRIRDLPLKIQQHKVYAERFNGSYNSVNADVYSETKRKNQSNIDVLFRVNEAYTDLANFTKVITALQTSAQVRLATQNDLEAAYSFLEVSNTAPATTATTTTTTSTSTSTPSAPSTNINQIGSLTAIIPAPVSTIPNITAQVNVSNIVANVSYDSNAGKVSVTAALPPWMREFQTEAASGGVNPSDDKPVSALSALNTIARQMERDQAADKIISEPATTVPKTDAPPKPIVGPTTLPPPPPADTNKTTPPSNTTTTTKTTTTTTKPAANDTNQDIITVGTPPSAFDDCQTTADCVGCGPNVNCTVVFGARKCVVQKILCIPLTLNLNDRCVQSPYSLECREDVVKLDPVKPTTMSLFKLMQAQYYDLISSMFKEQNETGTYQQQRLVYIDALRQFYYDKMKLHIAQTNLLSKKLAEAQKYLPEAQSLLRKLRPDFLRLQAELDVQHKQCKNLSSANYEESMTRREKLLLIETVAGFLATGNLSAIPVNIPFARRRGENACKPNPCKSGQVCRPDPKFCLVPDCPQHVCEPSNPCDTNPCPSEKRCVFVPPKCNLATCPRYNCVAQKANGPLTCRDILRDSGNKARTGIYVLTDGDGGNFRAFCDMETNGGGWMLSFKQTNFSSGSAEFNLKARGSVPLLSPIFDETSNGSLLDYANPSQIMFVSSVPGNWFATRGLAVYQQTEYVRLPKFCYLSNFADNSITVSKSWNPSKTAIWDVVDIQLMRVAVPDISAVTIGKPSKLHHPPQCFMPHCSSDRHGRYNGGCQNSTVGEGSWMIFTR